MPLPNFLIIGAAKSGTHSIYKYLRQHPQIYMCPVREPRFFAFDGETPHFAGPQDAEFCNGIVTKIEDYLKLFEGVRNQIAIGEASPVYLTYSEKAANRIRYYIPHVKLIAILRQPADRAYYAHQMWLRNGHETLNFPQALSAEEERRQRNWPYHFFYRSRGFYYALLKPYFECFPREQIRIYLYEDWENHLHNVLRDLFRFLGVDDAFQPRRHTLRSMLHNPIPLKSVLKPLVPPFLRRSIILFLIFLINPPQLEIETYRKLTSEYREDILKLQNLIGRDLSHWLDQKRDG